MYSFLCYYILNTTFAVKLLWSSHHRRVALQVSRFHPLGAHRAACAAGAGRYACLPLVLFFAFPPDLAARGCAFCPASSFLSCLAQAGRRVSALFCLPAGRRYSSGDLRPRYGPRPGPVDRSSFRRLRPSFDPPSLFAHSRSSPKGGGRI